MAFDTMKKPIEIPILETERLRLRAHSLEDFNDCVAMWAHPLVTRYTIISPSTEQRTWMRALSYLGHWQLMSFGYWAVEEKSSRKFIGELGFADFKREIEPSIKGIPEIGWAFAPEFHGKGYATEALRAAVAWGDKHLPSKRTVCIINPNNVASIKVAEKCGYTEYQKTTFNNEPTVMFERKA